MQTKDIRVEIVKIEDIHLETLITRIKDLPRFSPEHGSNMGETDDGQWLDRDLVLDVLEPPEARAEFLKQRTPKVILTDRMCPKCKAMIPAEMYEQHQTGSC